MRLHIVCTLVLFVLLVPNRALSQVGLDGFSFLGVNPQGFEEYTHDATGIVLVALPGDTFNMGSPAMGWRTTKVRFTR